MIDTVKTAFKERLDKNDWIDDTTRQASKDKVDAITKMVAYPDEISNVTYLNDLYAEVSVWGIDGSCFVSGYGKHDIRSWYTSTETENKYV